MPSLKQSISALTLGLAASFMPVSQAAVATTPAPSDNDEAVRMLARVMYKMSNDIIKNAASERTDDAMKGVLGEIMRIYPHDKTVILGNHVGLLKGNSVLMSHSGLPLLFRSCSEAILHDDRPAVQRERLNTCFGNIRTAYEFGIAHVDPKEFGQRWDQKLALKI